MNIILLRRKPVFIFGFMIGFMSYFLTKYIVDEYSIYQKSSSNKSWHFTRQLSENSEVFNLWFQSQNIHVSKIDYDSLAQKLQSNGKNGNGGVTLESEWLEEKVPITCVVFVEKLKLAATIKDTWGKHCNKLLFFSQHLVDINIPVIDLGIKFKSSWQLLCEVINYIWEKRNEISLNWTIFVRDDTIVIPQNLRYLLAPLDSTEPHYLGHPVVLWGVPYNVAQAGYVLSYGVLHRLMNMFNSSEKCAAGGKYWKNEDFYLGKHLSSLGIVPSDTRDDEQRGIFHAFSLNILLWGVAKPGSYYTRAIYPLGPECCSKRSITFNIVEPDKLRSINYMLFHLRVFGNEMHSYKPAPTPIPEDEVWKLALRDEFNLTDIDEMSSDKYFQIWRSKYSEPELFIAKNFLSTVEIISGFETNKEEKHP